MFVNIIARIVDNKEKDIGYILLDTDDNNKTLTVSKEQLVSVLKSKKLKVNNVKLVDNHLAGRYYSLSKLPYIFNNAFFNNIGYICIKNVDNEKFTLVKVREYGTEIITVSRSAIYSINIANTDSTGRILCKFINTKEKPLEIKNNTRDLDKEVLDKNIVWTIQEFKEYMKLHDYEYRLDSAGYGSDNKYELSNVDSECINLKIPREVVKINYLYNTTPDEINCLTFGPDVKHIFNLGNRANTENKLVINNLHFQNSPENYKEILHADGMNYLIVRNVFNLPYRKEIRGFGDYCEFNSINFGDHIYKIDNSFHSCTFNSSKLYLNVEDIYDSFTELQNIATIKLGNRLKNIYKSFNNSNLTLIDLSDATELKYISRSFVKLENIIRIDFSKTKLADMVHSVLCCEKLQSVVLPDTVKKLGGDTFYKCKIGTLKLPEGITVFPIRADVVDEIIYPSTVHELTSNTFIQSAYNPKLTFNQLNYIGVNAFDSVFLGMENVCNLKVDFSKCKLRPQSFKESDFTEFNSSEFKSLEVIPENCFENSKLRTVILADNIKEIKASAFKDCKDMKIVILGRNIENIASNAFSLMHSNFTVLYLVKGSYAHKFFNNKKNYNMVLCESLEDAINQAFNGVETDERKLDKFRLMLQGTKYEVLLNDDYINNVSYLYNIFKRIELNQPDVSRQALNTDKFKSLSLNGVGFLDKITSLRDSEIIKDEDNEITDEFISLSNFITAITDRDDHLYNINKDSHNFRVVNNRFIYINKRCIIVACYMDLFITKAHVLFIIIDDNIVYMTPFAYDKLCYNYEVESYNNFISGGVYRCNNKLSLGKELKPGDFATSYEAKVNGTIIPSVLASTVKDAIIPSLKYIGCLDNQRKFEVSTAFKKDFNTLFFDTLSGKFLETASRHTFRTLVGKSVFKQIDGIAIKNVYDISEISKINKEYFKEFEYAINNKNNTNSIHLALSTDEEIQQMFSDSNYDIKDNKQVVEFADAVYKYKVTNRNLLTLPIAELLLSSEFFDKSDVSIDNCRKAEYDASMTPLRNSNKMIIEYKKSFDMYIIGIIDMETSMKSKNMLKYSTMSINKILETFYFIGEARALNSCNRLCRVTYDKINPDDYYFNYTMHTNKLNLNGIKADLAIEKATGYTYIIGERWDTDFYSLFRFKKYIDAYKFIEGLYYNNTQLNHFRRFLYAIFGMSDNYSTNWLWVMRDKIIDGLPNNYPYIWDDYSLFDKLAKQPKN